jgi:hypothetical protein
MCPLPVTEQRMNIRAKIYGGGSAAEEPLLKAKKPRGAKADKLQSVAVAREARRASNARGGDRHRLLDEHARITHNGDVHDVVLINLSGGGAMVEGPFEPKLWDRVELHLGEHGDIECAVRWIRDDRIGLEFAHETRIECSPDEVASVLRQVILRSFPDLDFEIAEHVSVDRPANDEHRTGPRHPLIWNGTLHHDYQSDPVRVRNISVTGAMIETSAMVRVGSEPLLELSEAVSLSATIEWAVGDQVGLRFHSPFNMNLLAESRPSLATSDWVPPAYLDPDSRQSDDRWGRLNLVELRQELEGFLKR